MTLVKGPFSAGAFTAPLQASGGYLWLNETPFENLAIGGTPLNKLRFTLLQQNIDAALDAVATAGGGGGGGTYTLPNASSTVVGGTRLSVSPSSSTAPIATGTNDPRVVADQNAGTASIRTLGTGAQQAAAGNHTHDAAAIATGTLGSARLGAGIATSTTFLAGDGTWRTPSSSAVAITVADEGTPLAQRSLLNFTGAGVTVSDDAGNARTNITIPGGGGGGGTALTPTVVSALGSAYTWALASASDATLLGTLTTNCTMTLSGLSSGARAFLVVRQNGGNGSTGWGLTLVAGGASVALPINPTGSTMMWLETDGTDVDVGMIGGSGGSPSSYTLPNATTSVTGGTRLSVAPANAAVPVALGANDTSVALVVERWANNANTTSTVAVPDPATAGVTGFQYTLAVANTTFTFPANVAGKSFTLKLTQDATGNRLVTWPTVRWGTAGAPVLSSVATRIDLITFAGDGTNWYGSYALGY